MIQLSNILPLPRNVSNENLVALDAYNLIPGAAIIICQKSDGQANTHTYREAVVMKVTRDADSEVVHIIARFTDSEALLGTETDLPRGSRFGDTFSMTIGYHEKVCLFGLNVNPSDKNDANNGND